MLRTKLTSLLGIQHLIIQAGMGPFSNNNVCVATSNAGVLGLLSTSALFSKKEQPWVYQAFVETGEASMEEDMAGVLASVLKRTYRLTKDKGGVFGINVMVSAELVDLSAILIGTAVKVVEENPEMKKHFKVIFTSAGDPVPWGDKIKKGRFYVAACRPLGKGRPALSGSPCEPFDRDLSERTSAGDFRWEARGSIDARTLGIDMLSLLASGELKHPLRVCAHKFSQSAIEKIQKAGGTVEVITQ